MKLQMEAMEAVTLGEEGRSQLGPQNSRPGGVAVNKARLRTGRPLPCAVPLGRLPFSKAARMNKL